MLDLGTSFLAPPDKLLKLGRSSESTGALKFEFQLSLIFFSTSSILFSMTPFRFVRSFVLMIMIGCGCGCNGLSSFQPIVRLIRAFRGFRCKSRSMHSIKLKGAATFVRTANQRSTDSPNAPVLNKLRKCFFKVWPDPGLFIVLMGMSQMIND